MTLKPSMNYHHETLAGSTSFLRYRNNILLKAIFWRWETCGSPANIVSLLQGRKWPWIPWTELILSMDDSPELATYTLQQVVCPSKSVTCLWGTNISANSTLHCHLLCSPLSASWLKTLSVLISKGVNNESAPCIIMTSSCRSQTPDCLHHGCTYWLPPQWCWDSVLFQRVCSFSVSFLCVHFLI